MRPNKALEAWRQGRPTIGGWLSIGNAYSAELMAHLGFDWLCADMQHGMIGEHDLKQMLPANCVALYSGSVDDVKKLEKGMKAARDLGRQMVKLAEKKFEYPEEFPSTHFAFGTHTH